MGSYPSIVMAFEHACNEIKNLSGRPSDGELLQAYELFKQATAGDCNTAQPGAYDPKGKAKWGAWNANKGMSSDEAKDKYVDFAQVLKSKYGNFNAGGAFM